jgi:hypothetical protein
MNVFRLVLFLAGLAIYLLVRQSLHPGTSPEAVSPRPGPQQPARQAPSPTTGRPQITPHDELLKPDKAYVVGKNH